MKNEETKEIKTELESDDVKSEMDISIGDEEFVDFRTLANCNGDTQDTATDIKHEIADFIKREIDETNIKNELVESTEQETEISITPFNHKDQDVIPNFSCDFCKRKFKDEKGLKYHLEIFHLEKRYVQTSVDTFHEPSVTNKKKPCIISNHKLYDNLVDYSADKARFRQIMAMKEKKNLVKQKLVKIGQARFRETMAMKEKTKLVNHIEPDQLCKDQNGRILYECEQCEYKTKWKQSLKRHIKTVHEGIVYKCEQCEYKANWKQNLVSHIKSVHEGIVYKCEQCDYKAKCKKNLQIHIKLVHEGFEYKCEQCDYKAKWKQSLLHHKKSIHENIFSCKQCEHKSSTIQALQSHIQCDHGGFNYKCEQCDYKANQKEILLLHIKSVHVHEGLEYKCEQCDYKANYKQIVQSHIKSVHEGI